MDDLQETLNAILNDTKQMEELTQILYFNSRPPVVDDKFREEVEKERFLFN